MANKYIDTSILDRAMHFAIDAHANTERRGKGFPYSVHLMEAVEIAATITSDQEILAAAALHDTIEDTDVTLEQLRSEFGDRIASLVEAESDKFANGFSEKDSWIERKQAAIVRLANAPYDAKIVAMGDKLSNMRAIARDFERIGDDLWKIFHAPNGKSDHEWRYHKLAEALFDLAGTPAYREFVMLVEKTFGKKDYGEPVKIDLADYEHSGEGYNAVSYNHNGGHSMIKLYAETVSAEQPLRELRTAKNVFRMGLPTPMPGRFITDGKRYGCEFSRVVDKKSFARAISENPDSMERFATEFARMSKQLHSTVCNPAVFPSAADEACKVVEKATIFTDDEKKKVIDFVKSVPSAMTCLHGDLHIGNILYSSLGNFWIDLADFGYGNPLFDLGMTYWISKCNMDETTMRLYHINNEKMQEIWEIFLREYYGTDNPEKLAEYEKQIRPFAALKMIYFGVVNGHEQFIRENLLR
ncbi:MAG: TIGR02172 family protein [Bacteroidales bacterium]|nr:TIGR02172 family protein [Bacteroidales bacterium]